MKKQQAGDVRSDMSTSRTFLSRLGLTHPDAPQVRIVSDARVYAFAARDYGKAVDLAARLTDGGKRVSVLMPDAAGLHWWLAARLPSTARPARLSPPPQVIVAAGDYIALWRLADPVPLGRGAALVSQIIGRSGRVAIGEPVPMPGSLYEVAAKGGPVRAHVRFMVGASAPGYRVHGERLVSLNAGGDPVAASAGGPAPSGAHVYLGEGVGPWARSAYWAPNETAPGLLNFGVLVTGDSGSGKTQTIRVLIDGAIKMGLPVCIFDFKNDYADKAFTSKQGLRVHDVRRLGLPFNPLVPAGGEDGKAQPVEHIFTIAGVLKRVFGLGDRQAALLRDAMCEAFEARGVDVQAWQDAAAISAPSFADVGEVLAAKRDAKNATAASVLDRLSPLIALRLFPSSGEGGAGFEAMAGARVVLSLHELPSDEIKAALAELIIIRLHGYLVRGAQPRKLTRLLVLDEAWRVASSKHLENLAREGRAFGVGLAIGTQYPGDLPPDLAGSLATKVYLKNQQPDHRKAVAAALVGGGAAKEAAALAAFMEKQVMFQALIANQQYAPFASFSLRPYYQR